MRKTKIICTLGPATDDEEILRQLMRNGMNVARVNFSHGTHAEQKKRIERFKKIRDELQLPVALLLDTKGPEIRIKTFSKGKITLSAGEQFTLTTDEVEGTDKIVSVTYKDLNKDLKAGDTVLIDDGLIELNVIRIQGTEIVCEVKNGGDVSNNKSINIPNAAIHLPYMSEKDRADILFGIENDFDFIAASFVRTAYDVMEVKKILEENDGLNIMVISKIENQDGIRNIDEILKVSNGIMIARGDMGVEVPFEELPTIQKMLTQKCYKSGKIVITATQMLDSMIRNPRPTRAETTDVATAVFDGTSAVMLSGETAVGKYPVESLKTMAKIARRTEKSINYKENFNLNKMDTAQNVTNAISHATCMTAHDLEASAIIAITISGATARMASKFRPNCPIIAPTPSQKAYRQLALSWGVYPVLAEMKESSDELFEYAVDKALETKIVKNGDIVVIAAGLPSGTGGTTNMLKVQLVGRSLANGTGVNELVISGKLCVAKTDEEATTKFEEEIGRAHV